MITNADVAQFNNAQESLGNSFMQTRMLKDREEQLVKDNEFRQQGLDVAKDRNRIAEQDDKTRAGIAQKKAEIEEYTSIYEKMQKKVNEGGVSDAQIAEWNAALAQHPANHTFQSLLKIMPKGPEKPIVVSRDSGLFSPDGTPIVPKPTPADHSANLAPKLPPGVDDWFKAMAAAQAKAIVDKNFEEANRLAASIQEGRDKWGMAAPGAKPPSFSLGATNAPSQAITALPASPGGQSYPKAPPGAQEGSKVRNKATGQTGTVKGGVIIPD